MGKWIKGMWTASAVGWLTIACVLSYADVMGWALVALCVGCFCVAAATMVGGAR